MSVEDFTAIGTRENTSLVTIIIIIIAVAIAMTVGRLIGLTRRFNRRRFDRG